MLPSGTNCIATLAGLADGSRSICPATCSIIVLRVWQCSLDSSPPHPLVVGTGSRYKIPIGVRETVEHYGKTYTTRLPSNLNANASVSLGVVTSGHVTKMTVTPFYLPCPKTPWRMRTSRLDLKLHVLPIEDSHYENRDFPEPDLPLCRLYHRRGPRRQGGGNQLPIFHHAVLMSKRQANVCCRPRCNDD